MMLGLGEVNPMKNPVAEAIARAKAFIDAGEPVEAWHALDAITPEMLSAVRLEIGKAVELAVGPQMFTQAVIEDVSIETQNNPIEVTTRGDPDYSSPRFIAETETITIYIRASVMPDSAFSIAD